MFWSKAYFNGNWPLTSDFNFKFKTKISLGGYNLLAFSISHFWQEWDVKERKKQIKLCVYLKEDSSSWDKKKKNLIFSFRTPIAESLNRASDKSLKKKGLREKRVYIGHRFSLPPMNEGHVAPYHNSRKVKRLLHWSHVIERSFQKDYAATSNSIYNIYGGTTFLGKTRQIWSIVS
jgi:hypothetical protein